MAVHASGDEELLRAVRDVKDAKSRAKAQQAASDCVIQVRSAPRFAEDLQRAADGSLSDEQLACAVGEFSKLTPEQVEAASGAVLNPTAGEKSALAPIKKIYETCNIDLGDS